MVYNAHTLSVEATFPVQAETDSDSSLFISADSTTLFATSPSFVFAYDLATGVQRGWLPSLYIPQLGGSFGTSVTHPALRAIDSSGLLVGPIEEGIAFLDTTALRTGALGTAYLNGYVTPDTGPAAGGTSVQSGGISTAGIQSIFFGANAATSVSEDSLFTYAVTPPGPPGPVDVLTLASDGGVLYLPEAFSYGPTILQATPDLSTAEGTGEGTLFGYGFGPVGQTTIPPDLQLTVGGQAATITQYVWNAYGTGSPPMPLQAITYTLPPHTAGATDLSVTTASGTASLSGGITYLQATTQFPLAGAALTQGVYDPVRDLYYFANTSEIEVFSRTKAKWLSPILVPASPRGLAHRLWGIAISPDSSLLTVTDANTGQIFLLDPAGKTATQSFLYSSGSSNMPAFPAGVTISNTGLVYFTTFLPAGGTGGLPTTFRLNTNTGVFVSVGQTESEFGPNDAQLRPILSADGARLYVNFYGEIGSTDTSLLDLTQANAGQGCCYGNAELALSADQTGLAASEYLLDTDMHGESIYSYNVRESANIEYVYGAKLSPDGSLLFQPGTASIDVLDGHRGSLLHRVALPFQLSENFDALVSDGLDNRIVAITGVGGTGIAEIDLTSLPEPPPPTYYPAAIPRTNARQTSLLAPRAGQRTTASLIPHRTRTSLLLPARMTGSVADDNGSLKGSWRHR